MGCCGAPSRNDRPDILFTCRINKRGDITVENDSAGIINPAWAEYLDCEGLSKIPGRTYPQDIKAWNRLADEASQIMAGLMEVDIDVDDGDEIASLFGGSELELEAMEE
jgi:hypothetical protein